MKRIFFALSLSALTSAQAALQIPVIADYNLAETPNLWSKVKTDEVPPNLLSNKTVDDPRSSYSALFPKAFFQEDNFTVCYQNCSLSDPFKVKSGERLEFSSRARWEIIEQSNVYYWANRYFKFLEDRFYYRPRKFLKIYTNRQIKDETQGKVMKNNAFFNPRDTSLSFLPADKNLLFKLMGGKISRSGFDPSVIAHEASHYFFDHLFASPVNNEIGGLNEGFADYVANILLGNPKVGLVMLHGNVLRDSSSMLDGTGRPKVYAPSMEVHDLGERVSLALWKSRDLSDDKHELDRLVIDAVTEIGENPYSTVHHFKEAMLKRLPNVMSAQNLVMTEAIWEMIFPGEVNTIHNLNFLRTPIKSNNFIGFNIKQNFSEQFAKEMGVKSEEKFSLNIIKTEKISDSQTAILVASENESVTTPYWVVMDHARSNILGIYSLDRKLVTDAEELKSMENLILQLNDLGGYISDFVQKVQMFKELHDNKGDFSTAYKVSKKTIVKESLVFNGQMTIGERINMDLKKRVIARIIPGIPDIKGISLITIPANSINTKLPEINGMKVIGYQLQFATGTSMEIILNKIAQ